MERPPLPPGFRVEGVPGTEWRPGAPGATGRLVGGRPRRRITVPVAMCATVEALLGGVQVADAGPCAGDAGRRLIDIGAAVPIPPPGGPSTTDVTAVIPVRDGAVTLPRVLARVGDVSRVVVVDDGSTDDTATVARAHGADVISHARSRGPAAARNEGIAAASSDLVALVDADADPEPGWLEPLLVHFADPVVGGVAPRVRAPSDGTALGRYEAAVGPLDLGTVGGVVRADGNVPFVSTTALLLRRSAWDAVGGFSEDLRFGEDVDLAWRLAAAGHPLVYAPEVTVWHPHRGELGAHVRNRYRYATAGGVLARRHERFPRAAIAPPAVAVAFALALMGARRSGATAGAVGVAGVMAGLVRAGLDPLDAATEAARSGLSFGRGLAAGVSRPWLPIAMAVAAVDRRARLPVAAAVLTRSLTVRARSDPEHPLAPWLALRFLDDVASSAGAIRGCIDAGDPRALLPGRPAGPSTASSVIGEEVVLA